MVDDILGGAIRVLEQQGGRHFTTIRVAEETGISVGSLYQYFPNKESILFQVQYQEWLATSGMIGNTIGDSRHPPQVRLERMIQAFFRSELEEAPLRKALAETGVNMDNTPHFQKLREDLLANFSGFLGEFLPKIALAKRRFLADFVFTTIASLAEEVTSSAPSKAEVERWAATCSDMIISFLGRNRAPGGLT